MCSTGVPEINAGLGKSGQLLASFFQCPTLNDFHPPQLPAVYLLILIWLRNHCSYINLQQIISCSVRKMRSTSSTPGASGNDGYGSGPDPRWEALREDNLCPDNLCAGGATASLVWKCSRGFLSTVQQTQALFHTLREPRLSRTLL